MGLVARLKVMVHEQHVERVSGLGIPLKALYVLAGVTQQKMVLAAALAQALGGRQLARHTM